MTFPRTDTILLWMQQVSDDLAKKKPHMPPYDIETFDGCSGFPEFMTGCCFVHDANYHYCETRAERRRADVEFRKCIISKTKNEGPLWRWLWRVIGWLAYFAVRIFGRGVVSRKRRRARRG